MPYYNIHAYASDGELEKIKKEIKIMLDSGSYKGIKDIIELRTDSGETPLLIAARRGRVDVVKYLVDNNADLLTHGNFSAFIPLQVTILRAKQGAKEGKDVENFHQIIRIFLQKKPDLLDVCGDIGLTAFEIAFCKGDSSGIRQVMLQIIKEVTPTHPKLLKELARMREEDEQMKVQLEKMMGVISEERFPPPEEMAPPSHDQHLIHRNIQGLAQEHKEQDINHEDTTKKEENKI